MELGAIQQLTQNPSIILNPNNPDNKEILNLLRQIDDKLTLLLQCFLSCNESQLAVLEKRGLLSEELKAKS